jgi:hypothetical protein
MPSNLAESEILAYAIQEIRVLLSPYLGSENNAPLDVRTAAHLAYALHNEAIAIYEGRAFDTELALKKVEAIDRILNVNEGSRIAMLMRKESTRKHE